MSANTTGDTTSVLRHAEAQALATYTCIAWIIAHSLKRLKSDIMIQHQLEIAAQEARIATAMTLTPRGTHSSIDDIPLVGEQITFD